MTTKVTEEGSSTDGSANTKAHSELAQEAQSEAHSVEAVFEKLVNSLPLKATEIGWEAIWEEVEEAKAKINRLIIEARIDELKHIDDPVNVRLWFDGFYGVKDRIKELEG